jgi:hypothetical protein
MTRRLFAVSLLLLFAAPLTLCAGPNGPSHTWKGYVTDTFCGFNRATKPPTASCTFKCVEEQHAKYAFYNFADKKVYVLNPQDEAAKFAGQAVVVTGIVGGHEEFATEKGPSAGAIITASSITPEAGK